MSYRSPFADEPGFDRSIRQLSQQRCCQHVTPYLYKNSWCCSMCGQRANCRNPVHVREVMRYMVCTGGKKARPKYMNLRACVATLPDLLPGLYVYQSTNVMNVLKWQAQDPDVIVRVLCDPRMVRIVGYFPDQHLMDACSLLYRVYEDDKRLYDVLDEYVHTIAALSKCNPKDWPVHELFYEYLPRVWLTLVQAATQPVEVAKSVISKGHSSTAKFVVEFVRTSVYDAIDQHLDVHTGVVQSKRAPSVYGTIDELLDNHKKEVKRDNPLAFIVMEYLDIPLSGLWGNPNAMDAEDLDVESDAWSEASDW